MCEEKFFRSEWNDKDTTDSFSSSSDAVELKQKRKRREKKHLCSRERVGAEAFLLKELKNQMRSRCNVRESCIDVSCCFDQIKKKNDCFTRPWSSFSSVWPTVQLKWEERWHQWACWCSTAASLWHVSSIQSFVVFVCLLLLLSPRATQQSSTSMKANDESCVCI